MQHTQHTTTQQERLDQLDMLRDMQHTLRAIRQHVYEFNLLCDASGYVNEVIPSDKLDDLQSRLTQEYNWLDV